MIRKCFIIMRSGVQVPDPLRIENETLMLIRWSHFFLFFAVVILIFPLYGASLVRLWCAVMWEKLQKNCKILWPR